MEEVEEQQAKNNEPDLPYNETLSEPLPLPKKTKDASFQIGSKPKMYTRRNQAKPSTREFATQTLVLKSSIETQYEVQTLQEESSVKNADLQEEQSDSDDYEEEDDSNDESYVPSDEVEIDDDEIDTEIEVSVTLHADEPYKERQFLVAESCLLELLNKCKTCGDRACVTLKAFVGTMVVVEVLCAQGHDYVWRSQVVSNSMP